MVMNKKFLNSTQQFKLSNYAKLVCLKYIKNFYFEQQLLIYNIQDPKKCKIVF